MAFFPAISRLLIPSLPPRPILTAARSVSSTAPNPSSDAGEHWTEKHRRRLGLGDSPLELAASFAPWNPPNPGAFKINFSISMPELDQISRRYVDDGGRFTALARSSSGDLFGLAVGSAKFNSKLGMQLYALRAGVHLAEVLKEEGIHDGPVVYETTHILVFLNLDKRTINWYGGGMEDELIACMPDDLDDVGRGCEIYVGDDPDELMKRVAERFPLVKNQVEEDKKKGGLV